MEESLVIFDYLPYLPNDQNELNYIINLKETFELNYNSEKYHFAFFAYHMLFMSFVYYEIWQIREKKKEFEIAMIGFDSELENKIKSINRPFSLSKLSESGIFRVFRLLECPDDQIGNFKKIVKLRNEAAHVNGSRNFATKGFIDSTVNDIIRHIEKIQALTISIIEETFETFLIEYWNPELWESDNITDQIREILVRKHYLSLNDIRHLCKFKINNLQSDPNFIQIKSLFEEFKKQYSEE